MKKILSIFGICAVLFSANAQEKATDMLSINAGVIGAEVGYEKRLSDDFTLTGKISYEYIWVGDNLGFLDPHFIFTPNIGMEGKYYLNFNRRIGKGYTTQNNSANFISLELMYSPFWANDYSSSFDQKYRIFSIIPKYGLRRSLSSNFYLEGEVGPNFHFIDRKNIETNGGWLGGNGDNEMSITPYAAFRIGYRF